jgi:hypothetical protein
MARNRVIYQSEALYVSKNVNSTGSGEHRQLTRVQSANYNFDITRQDVNQFGQLARIDALVLQSPTVSLDFSYYPTDGFNERALGFYVQTPLPVYALTGSNLAVNKLYTGFDPNSVTGVGTGISGVTSTASTTVGNFSSGQMGNSSGQNFYIVTTKEGVDLNYETSENSLNGKSIIGIGNGFLTNYSIDVSVGNLPTASVTIEGLNMNSSLYTAYTGVSGNGAEGNAQIQITGGLSPQIDPTLGSVSKDVSGNNKIAVLPTPSQGIGDEIPSALRPGDIVLDFGSYGAGSDLGSKAVPIANISGSSDGLASDGLHLQSASLALPLSRTPIERLGSRFAFARVVDFPIVATLNVSAIVNEIQARNLAVMLDDNSERNITMRIKDSKNTAKDAMIFTLKGSRLKSESFSSSIGSNKTVDLVFETQIGGPNDADHGVFLSGKGTGDYTVLGWAY